MKLKKLFDAVKYPPYGKRGVGLARAQSYGFGFQEYLENKSNEIKLIIQIEHIEAIKNLDAIISIDGIDGTFIGPYDLSGSIGKPGQWDDIEVKKALTSYEKTAKKYGKLIGYHVIEPNYKLVKEKIEKGYNFIAFSLDTIFLGSQARNQMNDLKKLE